MNPDVAKAFHDIRNTYNGLLFHFDKDLDFKLDDKKTLEKLHQDLNIINVAEKSCKECKEVNHGKP